MIFFFVLIVAVGMAGRAFFLAGPKGKILILALTVINLGLVYLSADLLISRIGYAGLVLVGILSSIYTQYRTA